MTRSFFTLAVVFVIAIVSSSCNPELCPAYSDVEQEKTELNNQTT